MIIAVDMHRSLQLLEVHALLRKREEQQPLTLYSHTPHTGVQCVQHHSHANDNPIQTRHVTLS